MDEYSSRRAASGLVISRRGPSFLKDSSENSRDRNVQVCSRVGCSSKLNQMKDAQYGSPSKAKSMKTPFRSAHGKEVVGSSSRSSALSNSLKKSSSESKKKLRFHLEEADSETSSFQDEYEEASVSAPISVRTRTRVHPEPGERESGDAKSAEAGPSTSGPTNRSANKNNQKFGVGRQNSAGGSSPSFAFRQTNQGTRSGASSSRYNLRHLKCDSISDVVSSSSSSSPESTQGRRRDNGRKRIGEPENSLPARGKKMNGPVLDDRKHDTNRGVSISDSRRTRNLNLAGDNDAPSASNQWSMARTRSTNQENRNRLPSVESPLLAPSSTQADISHDPHPVISESSFSAQTPLHSASSVSRPGSRGEHMRSERSVGPYNIGRSFMNRNSLRQYNLDGIAEMLFALDGIEHDEEPTYEQLLVMETHLFLGGHAFQDQHREMRLDIDNMSYEELLALTERIGTVSTALPEEVLAKCIKRSIYQATVDCRVDEDDIKCCICQEEYATGDEVGRLACDHRYHTDCVSQWLRLKNWCPICKVSAAPSPPASPPP